MDDIKKRREALTEFAKRMLIQRSDLFRTKQTNNKSQKETKWINIAPIKVISLRPERFARLVRNAGSWAPYLEKFEATDGRKIDKKDWIEKKIITISSAKKLRSGELGCYESHRRVWKWMIDNNIPMAMICEDDFEFNPNKSNIQHIQPALKELEGREWHLLWLQYNNVFRKRRSEQISTHVYRPWGCQCLYSYLLTLKGAQLLYKGSLPMVKPVDVYVSDLSDRKKLQAFCLDPPMGHPIFQGSDTQAFK